MDNFTFAVSEDSGTSLQEALERARSSSVVVDCSYSHIVRIGVLPQQFRNILEIDLSCNRLVSLEGIQRLYKLRRADLSYNCLRELRDLQPLGALEYLSNVNCSHNPVCSILSYRVSLLQIAENLEICDGTPVQSKEKQNAGKVSEVLQKIVSSEIMCLRLENLKQKLRMHRQLIVNSFIVEYNQIDLNTFFRTVPFDQETLIAEDIKAWLTKRLKGMNDAGVLQCLRDQEDRIEDLKEACELLAQECFSLFIGNDVSGDPCCFYRESSPNIDLLDERLTYMRHRSEDAAAIQNAINTGLAVVVEKFRAFHISLKVFRALRKTVQKKKLLRMIEEERVNARNEELLFKVFQNWKNASFDRGHTQRTTEEQYKSYRKYELKELRDRGHRRILQYANFHRNKKIMNWVFQKFKELKKLREKKLSVTLSTIHDTSLLENTIPINKSLMNHSFKEHLNSRFRNLDYQIATRSTGNKLVEDINQRLNSIEYKILRRRY